MNNIVFGLIFGEGRTVEWNLCVCVCVCMHASMCGCVCQETTDQAVSITFNFIHPKINIRQENKALQSGRSMNRAETKTT